MKLRLRVTKEEPVRYISHLDYARTIEKVLRRANVPVAYSEGFNPHVKVAYASALAVGITSDAEYLDLDLKENSKPYDVTSLLDAFTLQLPKGISLMGFTAHEMKTEALMAVVNLASYEVSFLLTESASLGEKAVSSFLKEQSIDWVRVTPKSSRQVDIRSFIQSLEFASKGKKGLLKFSIKITPQGSVKPQELITVLAKKFAMPICIEDALIHRTGLYIEKNGNKMTPLDSLEKV